MHPYCNHILSLKIKLFMKEIEVLMLFKHLTYMEIANFILFIMIILNDGKKG